MQEEIKLKKLEQDDMNVIYNSLNQYRNYLIHQSSCLISTNDFNSKVEQENNKRDISIVSEFIRSLFSKAVKVSQPTKRSLKLKYHSALILSHALKFEIDYGNSGAYETNLASKIYYQLTPKL